MSLALRFTRPVELAARGRKWRLLFTHGALLDIEELSGLPAMEVNLAKFSAKLLRAVLFAALRGAGEVITIEEAGTMLRPGDTARVRSLLIEAWKASMPVHDHELPRQSPNSESQQLTILDAWAEARYDLHLSDDEWQNMTPRMLQALSRRRLRSMRWRELMNAVQCAHTVNHSFRAPQTPSLPNDYMLHDWPDPVAPPVTGETVMKALRGL